MKALTEWWWCCCWTYLLQFLCLIWTEKHGSEWIKTLRQYRHFNFSTEICKACVKEWNRLKLVKYIRLFFVISPASISFDHYPDIIKEQNKTWTSRQNTSCSKHRKPANPRLCSDEGLTLKTSANTLFTAFSISTSTLRWYIVIQNWFSWFSFLSLQTKFLQKK